MSYFQSDKEEFVCVNRTSEYHPDSEYFEWAKIYGQDVLKEDVYIDSNFPNPCHVRKPDERLQAACEQVEFLRYKYHSSNVDGKNSA